MIYTFLIDSEKVKFFSEKRDCQAWQPLTLVPKELLESILKTKNDIQRFERLAAYTLLFFACEKYFGVKITKIAKSPKGKPYVSEKIGNCEVFFSLSHSHGISAVTLSDEDECGVDIERLPDNKTIERVEKRFLDTFILQSTNELLPILAEPTNDGFSFSDFNLNITEENYFLKKWTQLEATLKRLGGGFSDLAKVNNMVKDGNYMHTSFILDGNVFGISVSVN